MYLTDNTSGYQNGLKIHERIICYDNFEVMCDSKKIDCIEWQLDKNTIKNCIFNRSSRLSFDRWSTCIGYIPYSDRRALILRTDLPLRFGRLKGWSWGDKIFLKEGLINAYLQGFLYPETLILARQIYLIGINKRGMPQSPVLLTARNGEFFTVAEVLVQANIIQTNISLNMKYKSDGVGIYRCGIKGAIPSYFIWEYYDMANILSSYEEIGIDITYA